MAACACRAASALWCAGAAGEKSPAAWAWAACNAARVGSGAVVATGREEALTAGPEAGVGATDASAVALVCVLR